MGLEGLGSSFVLHEEGGCRNNVWGKDVIVFVMAKLLNGIFGPFVGKVGPVVGYVWKGRAVMRSYVARINYPNTALQQEEKGWFVGMVRFAAEARGALLLGLRERARRERMTEGNWFVKRNKGCFGRGSGASGVSAGAAGVSAGVVDYGGMVISEGRVAPVLCTGVAMEDGGRLRIGFERYRGAAWNRASDRVYGYVYNATARKGLLAGPVRRDERELVAGLPAEWAGDELHVWLFAVDEGGRASRSVYGGFVRGGLVVCGGCEEGVLDDGANVGDGTNWANGTNGTYGSDGVCGGGLVLDVGWRREAG